jgi:hypothetical protein
VPAPAGGEEASWDVVTNPDDLVRWEASWAGGGEVIGLFPPALLDDPDCVVLACRRDGAQVGGVIAYTAGGVTGISNVFKSGIADGPLWAGVVRAIARVRPGLPIVGYERGEDLAEARQAGFQVLGPLRVWTRESAVP